MVGEFQRWMKAEDSERWNQCVVTGSGAGDSKGARERKTSKYVLVAVCSLACVSFLLLASTMARTHATTRTSCQAGRKEEGERRGERVREMPSRRGEEERRDDSDMA